MVVATITAGLVKFWEVWFGLVWLHMVLMITLAISNGFKKLLSMVVATITDGWLNFGVGLVWFGHNIFSYCLCHKL